MTKNIDLKLLARLVLKKWFLFVIVAAFSLFAAMIVTIEAQPDTFTASTSLSSIVEGSTQESLNGFRLLSNYSSLVTSERIATAAREMLPDSVHVSAAQIRSMVSANFNIDSSFLFINCKSTDPYLALSISNAVAESFVAEISNITGDDTIKIYDRATSAILSFDGKSEQRKTRLIIPTVSLFLLLVVIVLWALFSDRVNTVSELEFNGEVNIIGVIPSISKRQ